MSAKFGIGGLGLVADLIFEVTDDERMGYMNARMSSGERRRKLARCCGLTSV
jgi:hypothetical protein